MKIKVDKFGGMVPRLNPHDLPDSGAQLASDCHLAHGDLRALYGIKNVSFGAIAPIKGLYSEDGLNFYSWNQPVRACRTPMIDQNPRRFYYSKYNEGSGAWGFFNALTSGMNPSGGNPAAELFVGVKRPLDSGGNAYQPILKGPISTFVPPGFDSCIASLTVWYEKDGLKTQVQDIPLASGTMSLVYLTSGLLPALDTAVTASDAVFSGKFTVVGYNAQNPSGSTLFTLVTANSVDAKVADNNKFGYIEFRTPGGFSQLFIRFRRDTTVAYVYTLVNSWGEESSPSDSATWNKSVFEPVTVTTQWIADASRQTVTSFNLYRSNTSSSGETAYQYVGTFTGSAGIFNTVEDDVSNALLGEVCPSITWDCPPSDLGCIAALPNAFLAAFKGNQLYFSDPLHAYAWPIDYIQTLPYDIVGIMPYGNGLLVTTKAYPYLVYGSHPASVTVQKINVLQSGVSFKSMADLGHSAAYAAPDGIVLVQGSTAQIDTSLALFSRDDWQRLYNDRVQRKLEDMIMGVKDGAILAFWPSVAGFSIRLDEGNGILTNINVTATAATLVPQTDQYYLGISNGIWQYHGDQTVIVNKFWQSKDFVFEHPVNFGAIKVVASPMDSGTKGSETITITAIENRKFNVYDGTGGDFTNTQTISTFQPQSANQTFIARLNSGFKAKRWNVSFSGTNSIKSFSMATNMKELTHE